MMKPPMNARRPVKVATRSLRIPMALAAMLPIMVALFISEIARLGIPDIWFPFNIGVTLTQYAYALALPLLCFALTAGARRGGLEPKPNGAPGRIPEMIDNRQAESAGE